MGTRTAPRRAAPVQPALFDAEAHQAADYHRARALLDHARSAASSAAIAAAALDFAADPDPADVAAARRAGQYAAILGRLLATAGNPRSPGWAVRVRHGVLWRRRRALRVLRDDRSSADVRALAEAFERGTRAYDRAR